MVTEKIFGNSIGAFVLYAKSTVDGALTAVKVNPATGALQVDTELTANIDPTGLATELTLDDIKDAIESLEATIAAGKVQTTPDLPPGAATEQGLDDILAKLTADPATQTTLAAILAKLIAAPSTEAKQDTIITALQTIDNFISGTKGLVTEDNSAAILAKLTKIVQLHANIDFSSASPYTAIAAPGAGYRIRIVQLLLMSGSPTPVNSEVAIKSGSTTIKTVKGVAIAIDSPEHCNLGTNEALVLQATTADRIVGGVDYYLEAV